MNILLLQLKRIGDLILTTPAIHALRAKFPDAKLNLAVSSECADLLPAISGVDRVYLVRRNPADLAVLFHVATTKFEYCVDFTRNDRSALLAFLSGARKRVVSFRLKDKAKARARVYNEFAEHQLRGMHTIDYHLALLEPLGVQNASPHLHLDLPRECYDKASELRRINAIAESFVIFHPGAARPEKYWGAEHWADVINRARSLWKVPIVITGGRSTREQDQIRQIKTKLDEPIVDLSGRTDLLVLAALIAQARLLITVDSAPMHLAAATQTPQVVLFGPTNPFHWRPRESPALILQGDSAQPIFEFSPNQKRLPVNQISTEAVINAISSLLSAAAPATQSA
jgi:predicted lipopolysaccharide heptosyltransferase III